MNESSEPKIPKKCARSVIRKSQIIGACAGGLGTFVILFLSVLNANIALSFGILVQEPMSKILLMLGLEKWLYSHEGVSWAQFLLAVAINTFLFFLVGTITGWVIGKLVKKRMSQLL